MLINYSLCLLSTWGLWSSNTNHSKDAQESRTKNLDEKWRKMSTTLSKYWQWNMWNCGTESPRMRGNVCSLTHVGSGKIQGKYATGSVLMLARLWTRWPNKVLSPWISLVTWLEGWRDCFFSEGTTLSVCARWVCADLVRNADFWAWCWHASSH